VVVFTTAGFISAHIKALSDLGQGCKTGRETACLLAPKPLKFTANVGLICTLPKGTLTTGQGGLALAFVSVGSL
jgi:hypothetical protein